MDPASTTILAYLLAPVPFCAAEAPDDDAMADENELAMLLEESVRVLLDPHFSG